MYAKHYDDLMAINRQAAQSLSHPDICTKLMMKMRYQSDDSLDIQRIVRRFDVRHITPNQMQELSSTLYRSGYISAGEYLCMSSQPETHPMYNQTVGRHKGIMAQPDEPRDYVAIWEDNVTNHQSRTSIQTPRTRRVLLILRHLEMLRKMVV